MTRTISKGGVTILKENIIRVMINDDVHFQSIDMIEVNETRNELIGNRRHVILLVSGNGTTFGKEALELIYDERIPGNCIAIGIVVNSLAQRFIANFFKQM